MSNVKPVSLRHVRLDTICLNVSINGTESLHSHYPYSCDGEGRQADRQDDPGSHWAGSVLALFQAWGERRASGLSGNTAGGIR